MADKLSSRYSKWFIVSSGLILFITGMAKAWSAVGSARALDVADPIFRVPFRQLMLEVGLLELFIAFFCLFTEQDAVWTDVKRRTGKKLPDLRSPTMISGLKYLNLLKHRQLRQVKKKI